MSHCDRSRLGAGELEKLQRWRMHLDDEFKEILDEVDALKKEPLANHSDAARGEKLHRRACRTERS
jgi:hypothetical protein